MIVADVTPNMQVLSKKGLAGRSTPYITIGKTIDYTFYENQTITIIERPRNYQGCGRCVKFRVNDVPHELYCFWSDFKKHVKQINH